MAYRRFLWNLALAALLAAFFVALLCAAGRSIASPSRGRLELDLAWKI